MPDFVHLHNHTEFSLLDGAAKIKNLTKKAADLNMSHIAITDHGNMYGVPKFVLAARKQGVKPIVGCEFYICRHPIELKDVKQNPRYHQILWAKDAEGYKNLCKLCSFGYTDGFYYKPRIDRETLKAHSKGLIASSCCLASEINRAIVDRSEEEAEKILFWYLDVFGREDYYLEIQRHNLGDMEKCNQVLIRWSKKHNLKIIATNDVHYVNEEDADAHDLLLALQTASDYYDPNRFRFTDDKGNLNKVFYFKSQDEMATLFHDVPQALDYTVELAERCQFEMNLAGDMMLPNYKVPPGYLDMDDYLRFLTYEGAKKRYPEMTSEIVERIDFELKIMKKMGYAGYFLIVQSFTTVARERGVYVGPGRGSAAGSVVAYALGIINVEPLRYNLLFERFLNPDRVSPPDIDIDFDDEGRQEVIDYVVEQYGRQSVSQVITYGTMGAKTALRDVGRTLNIPLSEVTRITKYIPDRPGMTFSKALDPSDNPDHVQDLEAAFIDRDPQIRKMMKFARTLEGTARHTGVHACAVIIAPEDITNLVPIALAKDKSFVTQYDGPMAEQAGLLKMDFLGLKTLSIIKTGVRQVKERFGVIIDPEEIDITDKKTYELYQRGETVATFQFESDGMRKYLKQLKPTNLEDLIAMNALYRPGPMDNIPSFVNRKHGRETVVYPHPMLEDILKNTYGIMVYQEQIMQVAQRMANYSLGQADLLRRAMGKKKLDVMKQERVRFIAGAKENGVDEKKAMEVFDTMEKFASYGFNKSHAAAYSLLAFRTAYLKAHYPPQYMAAVLTHNVNDITKITFFIEECRSMAIKVLSPSVNESKSLFAVTDESHIRFGMSAIKGVGSAVVAAIVKEKEDNGPYISIFDMAERVPAGTLNRKVMECLAYSGAFDSFDIARSRYFAPMDALISERGVNNVLERAVNYGNKVQQAKASAQVSLFGGMGGSTSITEPPIPEVEEWTLMERLNFEKDVIGFYLSGHPLDEFKLEIKSFATARITDLDNLQGRDVKLAGIVTKKRDGMTKKGNRYATFTVEDFSGSLEFALFGEDFARYYPYVDINAMLFISAKSTPSFRDPGVFELKVTDIKFLEDTFNNMTNGMCLNIPLNQVTEKLTTTLEKLFEENKGTKHLEFNIIDPEIPAKIPLQSRRFVIEPNTRLMKALEDLNVDMTLL